MKHRPLIAMLATALLMLMCGCALCQTTAVEGYILDPNWYARHPKLSNQVTDELGNVTLIPPYVFGTGMYEYGVGGSRPGDEGQGFSASTENSSQNNYWGIYGRFRKTGQAVGTWNLATWSRWWRPAFLFGTSYPYSAPVSNLFLRPIVRLHANMWSYGASWPGNTFTPKPQGEDGTWNELGQTFVATGSSITMIVIRSPWSGVNFTATIRDGGPNGAQVGPARTFTSPDGPSDVRLFYSGGEVPTIPGHTYYVKLKASGTTKGLFCESEPIPDNSDPMPNGCVYRDGVPDESRDLGLTICSDDDGILTNLNIDKAVTYAGGATPQLVSAVGQTFVARGVNLLYYGIYCPDHSTDYVATLYDGITNGEPGEIVGFAKKNSYTRYSDPEVVFVWEPGECPLTPGHTYYIEVTRASEGQFQFCGSPFNTYSNGVCYVDRTLISGWDVSGCIMEEESAYSATRASVQFTSYPAVAPADRGARSLTVRWTTDIPSDSAIEYGAWNANYTSTYYSSGLVTDHVATLTGLDPNTMYHFRVKSAANLYRNAVSRDLVNCTINETPNLLVNPSFEELPPAPPTHHRTIPPPWYFSGLSGEAGDGSYFASVPPYAGSWLAEPAINGLPADGWCYQTVPAVPGAEYNFSIALWTQLKEQNTDKYDVWNNDRRVDYVKLGIDPTGGTDRTSTSIKWTPAIYSQQSYTVFGTHATATSDHITVFVQMQGNTIMANSWHIYGIDDCRLTSNYFSSLSDLKGSTPDGAVVVDQLYVTALPSETGDYFVENKDRTQGIRVKSSDIVGLGSRVKIRGTLKTDPDTHERYIDQATFLNPASDKAPDALGMLCKNLGGQGIGTLVPAVPGSVGPHNSGLVVRITGKVTVKDTEGSSYIWVNDGSMPGDGLKVDTSRLSPGDVPDAGADVGISGISALYLDNNVAAPMLIPRRASDIQTY
jgi:hypothetical protein